MTKHHLPATPQRAEALTLFAGVIRAITAGIQRTQALTKPCTTSLEFLKVVLTQAGWLGFVVDEARAYGDLALKVTTKALSKGGEFADDLGFSIEANSLRDGRFLVKAHATVTQLRYLCADCTCALVEYALEHGNQYIVNVTGLSAGCQTCGAIAPSGTGCLTTTTYHVANLPRSVVARADGGENMTVRGFIGMANTVTAEQVVSTVLALRHVVSEMLLAGTATLTPVKAQHQHNAKVITAENLWREGEVIHADKEIVSALSF